MLEGTINIRSGWNRYAGWPSTGQHYITVLIRNFNEYSLSWNFATRFDTQHSLNVIRFAYCLSHIRVVQSIQFILKFKVHGGVICCLDNRSLEAFAVTELNKIFSGRQPRRGVKVLTPPSSGRGSHSIPCPGRMEIYTPQSRAPIHQFWFYQAVSSTLKMGTELVQETLDNFCTMIWLCA